MKMKRQGVNVINTAFEPWEKTEVIYKSRVHLKDLKKGDIPLLVKSSIVKNQLNIYI